MLSGDSLSHSSIGGVRRSPQCRCLAAFVLAIAVIFCSLVFPNPKAYAVPFSQWCYGSEDIVELFNINGTIYAVGEYGSIASFNGVYWDGHVKQNGYYAVAHLGDNERIYYAFQNSSTMTVGYWSRSEGLVSRGTFSTSYYYGEPAYITLDKNNNLYVATKDGYLHKNTGGTSWIRVGCCDEPHDSRYRVGANTGAKAWLYVPSTNSIWAAYEPDNYTNTSRITRYDINTDQFFEYGSAGNRPRVLFLDNNGVVTLLTDRSSSSVSQYKLRGSSFYSDGYLPVVCYKAKVIDGVQWYYGGNNSIYLTYSKYTWQMSSSTLALEKGDRGEMYVAGENGHFAVFMNNDTTFYYDSAVFSDYILGDINSKISEISSLSKAAKTSADNAKKAADAAKSSADAAKKAAEQARDAANAAQADTTYIRNTQLPALENKIANLETVINNNINNDTMSPIVKIQTVSGARATSASSIPCIITVTDNSAGPFEYRVNNGSWIALPSNGRVSLPVTQPGMNTITVEVKDPSGNLGREAINIRKL